MRSCPTPMARSQASPTSTPFPLGACRPATFGWQRFVRQYRDWRAGQSELPRTQHPTQVEHRRRNTAGRLASRRCTTGTARHPAGLAARRARQSGAPRLFHRLLLSGTQSAAKHRPFRILPRMARRRRSAVMESGRRRTRDHHEPQQDRSRPGSRIRAARRGPLRLHRACRRFRDADGHWVEAINNPAHVFSMPCPQEVPVNAAIRSRTKKPTLKAE